MLDVFPMSTSYPGELIDSLHCVNPVFYSAENELLVYFTKFQRNTTKVGENAT